MLLGFGFGGALLLRNGFPVWIAALGGLGIGFVIAAVYVVLMRSLYKLRSDGTSVLSEAVNQSGTVYLRVPGLLSGPGEIQVSFGGRLQNVKAFTDGPELPTGTVVRVVAMHGGQALLVEKFR
jgi:membrane protein implicated in regulation of membrane protease activity